MSTFVNTIGTAADDKSHDGVVSNSVTANVPVLNLDTVLPLTKLAGSVNVSVDAILKTIPGAIIESAASKKFDPLLVMNSETIPPDMPPIFNVATDNVDGGLIITDSEELPTIYALFACELERFKTAPFDTVKDPATYIPARLDNPITFERSVLADTTA